VVGDRAQFARFVYALGVREGVPRSAISAINTVVIHRKTFADLVIGISYEPAIRIVDLAGFGQNSFRTIARS
jgi:hypothetical protein